MKIFNVAVTALPVVSVVTASSDVPSATKNIRGGQDRLLQSGPPGPSFDDSNYQSDDFDLVTNDNGEYGRCMDRDGEYFDWMWYDWESMDRWMSSWDYDYYSPQMCEEWCYSSQNYYRHFHGFDERMMNDDDYEYYYKFFVGFEVSREGCGCLFEYEFGHWMESYGMDTHSWPGGHAPIYTTDGGYDESSDGDGEHEDVKCYRYNNYDRGQWDSQNDYSDRFLQSSSSCSGEKQFQSTYLKADIDTEYFKATVYGKDSAPGQAEWTITIDHVDPNLCPEYEELHYHIHQWQLLESGCKGYAGLIANGSVQQCMTTGAHVDPSLACGGASQYLDTTCKALNYAEPYSTRCTTERQKGCEYGDLSGKVGQVKLDTTEPQVFHDQFIQTPIADYYYAQSIVFHCGEPRVACANLEVASADDIYY